MPAQSVAKRKHVLKEFVSTMFSVFPLPFSQRHKHHQCCSSNKISERDLIHTIYCNLQCVQHCYTRQNFSSCGGVLDGTQHVRKPQVS